MTVKRVKTRYIVTSRRSDIDTDHAYAMKENGLIGRYNDPSAEEDEAPAQVFETKREAATELLGFLVSATREAYWKEFHIIPVTVREVRVIDEIVEWPDVDSLP